MPHSTPSSPAIDAAKTYGDWRDDLLRDGYAVVKDVIPRERCDYYIEKMYDWVGRFPWGFDRNDRSTWGEEQLPTHMKGGMYHGYRVQHEKFMWEARTEPGVIDTFAKIWGTKDLLVSFDGMNFTLPPGGDHKPIPQTQPWPHIDQDPLRKGMHCVQGILNFAPNGPKDGGLIVMKGSTSLMVEFFTAHPQVIGRPTWGTRDWFGFEKSEVQWFEERGPRPARGSSAPLTYDQLIEENSRLKTELENYKRSSYQPLQQQQQQQGESLIQILESQVHLPATTTPRQRKVWHRSDIVMPSRECSDALLEHGFVWTSWIHFGIHIQTFRREHEMNWSNRDQQQLLEGSEPLWLAIYFGFIAMSLMFMNEQEALVADLPSADPGQLIHNWYDATIFFMHEADFLRIHDIRAVQATAILLGLAKNVGDFNLQPVLQATGLRIGHCLGIDRAAPTSFSADPILQEVSHRVWWTMVICEWLQRPDSAPLIHETDFDVPLPLNLTDKELLDPYLREHPDEVEDHPRPVQYHHTMIGLAQVRYRFKMELTRLRQDHRDDNEQYSKRLEELVSRSDEALANLIMQLPNHLSSENLEDEDGDETCVIWQRISLSLSFLFYRMAINRELQDRWVESSSLFTARSQAICLASAHAIVSLVDRHSDAFMRHRPWATASNLFSAAATLVIEAQFSNDTEIAATYIQNIKPSMAFFRRIQDQNAVAARAMDVLTKYIDELGFAQYL
ncbi:Hypothetical protein PENO1_004240 [Penicillium occitanis (nom. inval.)]|nr:Hypothetical protein PENO1_004240 [Penicillium occitanis (nom. inval.)]PCH10366.1 hypothetical protein PENOC_001890 [Penicillium occitanis (nom. inval.)]